MDQQSAVDELTYEKSILLAKVSANPFLTSTTIMSDKMLRYNIYSINGTMLEYGNTESSVEIGNRLKSGVYLLRLIDESNKAMQVIKLVKM